MDSVVTASPPTLPEGPQGPRLWQLLQWIARPIEFMNGCVARYGDTFTVRLWQFRPLVFFSHPQAVQDIFKADPALFDVGLYNGILRPMTGDNTLLLLDGDRHQQRRQLVMPPFHGERMRAYGSLICEITRQVAAAWSVGQPFRVRPSMQEISLRVILRAVFGLVEGDRYETLRGLLEELLEAIGSPLSSSLLFIAALQQNWGAWSPWGQFVRRRAQIDQLIYSEIRARRAEPIANGEDILSLLLAARDEAGQPMTDQELRDELVTLLLVGHETTASAMTWALYWIHQTPGVLEALRHELEALPPDADATAIARLPYLNAVCQETLRIYPIAPITFPRVTREPVTIRGQRYDAGVGLVPCIYLMHRRPDLYPDPAQFRPERFLERSFSAYEYLPFGGSNRRCLGMALALYEMKLAIATLLTEFDLALVSSRPLKPSRRGVTLAPPSSLQMVVNRRRSQ